MTISGVQRMTRLTEGLSGWRTSRTSRRKELIDALNTHAGLILSSAVRVLGNMQDAEDVAQDIAERLLRSPPKAIQNWPAYLKTLSINGAIDRLRKRRPTVGPDDIADSKTPESQFEAEQRALALRGALARLGQRDANLFSLYYLADLSQAEIARQLDMRENAVSVALHRVRHRISDDLKLRLQLDKEDK